MIDKCEHLPDEYCNADFPVNDPWRVCQWNPAVGDKPGHCREVPAAQYEELCLVARRTVTKDTDVLQPLELVTLLSGSHNSTLI